MRLDQMVAFLFHFSCCLFCRRSSSQRPKQRSIIIFPISKRQRTVTETVITVSWIEFLLTRKSMVSTPLRGKLNLSATYIRQLFTLSSSDLKFCSRCLVYACHEIDYPPI